MQTLLLSGTGETDLLSCRNIRISESWVGTILAGRYRISKAVDLGGFKAHDLTLDQTVMVRGPLLTPKGGDNIWREKAQQFTLVRNPNFLNVLEVVSEKAGDFLISEYPRGKSVADLLIERSRFDVKDIVELMMPLAGALDLAASFTCSPNLISGCCLFTESKHWTVVSSEERALSELAQLCVRLDVSEIIMSGRHFASSRLISKVRKSGYKGWAVRQAALLAYQLLGGDPNDGIGAKRRFKPINHLSKLGNSVLYYGLLGSPRFVTSESFIRKLEAATGSGAMKAKVWSVPALHTRERSLFNSDTNGVLRRFNRDTKRVVAGVLGAVTFAALAFAVLVPEHHLNVLDLTEEPGQATSGYVFNAALPMLFEKGDLNTKIPFNSRSTEGESRVSLAGAEFYPAKDLRRTEVVAEPAPAPVLISDPGADRLPERPNGSKWSPFHKKSGRVVRTLFSQERYKSLDRIKDVHVKMRLLALWHQSLVRNESTRRRTLFSNSLKEEEKKVSYMIQTNH